MRDNFTLSIKLQLERSTQMKCSNPSCRISTVSGRSNLGEAAHICAASPGGPRYDSNMSSEERKSFDNGIWLCRNCASLIDKKENEHLYSRVVLKTWKREAESIGREISDPSPSYPAKEEEIRTKLAPMIKDLSYIQKFKTVMCEDDVSYFLRDHDLRSDYKREWIAPLYNFFAHHFTNLEPWTASEKVQEQISKITDKYLKDVQLQRIMKIFLLEVFELRNFLALNAGMNEFRIRDAKAWQPCVTDFNISVKHLSSAYGITYWYCVDDASNQITANNLKQAVWERYLQLLNQYEHLSDRVNNLSQELSEH